MTKDLALIRCHTQRLAGAPFASVLDVVQWFGAIQAQDFGVVRSMVFIGSALYIIGLVLTDISYTLVDPRVRLES